MVHILTCVNCRHLFQKSYSQDRMLQQIMFTSNNSCNVDCASAIDGCERGNQTRCSGEESETEIFLHRSIHLYPSEGETRNLNKKYKCERALQVKQSHIKIQLLHARQTGTMHQNHMNPRQTLKIKFKAQTIKL